MKKLLLLALLISACGKSGSSGGKANVTPVPLLPVSTVYQVTLLANKQPTSPGNATMSQNSTLTLPNPSDISVSANQSEFYHASLTAGTVSCDYIHDAGASFFRFGSGCTGNATTVALSTGDSITLAINGSPAQFTSISVTLNLVGN